ncbi:MAG: Xaa-Pro peptidase family protein [Bryobacteraceae bacterium]
MRSAWPGLLLLLCLAPALAQIPKYEYGARRHAVQAALPDGVLVLFGNEEDEHDFGRFYQEPNFEYLTGWREPGAILLLSPNAETLFLPKHDPIRERYAGHRAAAEDENVNIVTGFRKALPVTQFEEQFQQALSSYSRVYTLADFPGAAKIGRLAPMREILDARAALASLRKKKSVNEIALIQKSVDASVAAHREIWKRMAPGLAEYQLAATFTYAILDKGCERNAYAPIVATGPSAIVLDYSKYTRRIEPGDLVLIDAGAQCDGYAADITRTVPANGKFTPRERELYGIVFEAQKAVIAAIKPGAVMGADPASPGTLYKIAYDYINTHGKDLEGKPLGRYVLHGTSHHIGLEVHDAPPSSYSQPLAAGMVISAEPGIYIPREGIGIRIEDTVLVTPEGAKVLSGALPKDPAEIEKIFAAR